MPVSLNRFTEAFFRQAPGMTFGEIAYETAHTLLDDSLPEPALREIVERAVSFDAPLVELTESIYALELFRGPTLAFKDFGARFMAGLMTRFAGEMNRELTILVATSGDTGGAVASGFFKKSGIRVIILYPRGKVSPLQEKQLTTFGHNITAMAIDGTFDDCQKLVKSAFLDEGIRSRLCLSSANSINIARLIPQSFYYAYAWSRLSVQKKPLVFSVPSGNFGNLTAGLLARRMGLPVHHFIAATNSNAVFPEFLDSGVFRPRPSVQTLSNAMDVGNPSNLARITDLFHGDTEQMRKVISSYSIGDAETGHGLLELRNQYGYSADPHGAVAYLALQKFMQSNPGVCGVFLETAHPAKFIEVVETITGETLPLPDALLKIKDRTGNSVFLENNFDLFREYLLNV